jgi:drug/metabolite transporter (DMT)-like permease
LEDLSLAGILLGLLAAASYTGTLNVNGHVALDVPSELRSTLMMTGAAILTLIIFPPQFLANGTLLHGLWIFALLIGLFGVVIPPYLYAKGIPTIGPAMASIIGSVELPVVIISSSIFLKETTTVLQWIGVLLILLGIIISEARFTIAKRFRRQIN